MSAVTQENEEPSSSTSDAKNGPEMKMESEVASPETLRPPAKRPLSNAVIEISDTESDDSDICAVTSYQASADEVKKIRGDYSSSSSSSSSSDYSSDSESPWEDGSILLEDEVAKTTFPKAQLNPRADRMEEPKLNPNFKSQELMDKLTEHWNNMKDLSNADITLTNEPYRLCLLHELLQNPEIINNIIDDMNTLDWSRKKLDLYEFHQTADLASLTWQRSIKGIYELLKTDVMSWVSKITGLELTSVSASCSLYGPGDHLLVHDDLMGDRRVAFILYLAPWKPNMKSYRFSNMENGDGDHDKSVDLDDITNGWASWLGGALQLLSCEDGAPVVKRSVYPSNNMLAFFQVDHNTYHQVDEVLSLELPRLSINGWFHGPVPPSTAAPSTPPPPVFPLKPHNDITILQEWVDPAYMCARARLQIQKQVEQDSEVSLTNFMLPAKYSELLDALRSSDTSWEHAGPLTRRRYTRVPAASLEQDSTSPVGSLVRLLSSNTFFKFLADCTDLKLTQYEDLEVQKWTPGDFSMLPPREKYQKARLELTMYLGVPGRPLCGGATSYVAPEEGGASPALVTLPPRANALALVYCDAGAAAFTKYLSKITMRPGDCFYIVTCTYLE